jgi:hypothetical protein
MRISEYIAEKGLPENSLKRWEKDLLDLKHYYLARTRTGDPVRLQLDGPAVRSPDGKYTLRLVPEQIREPAGTSWDRQSLVISGDDVGRETLWLEGTMDFFWGPPESGFAVIRSYHRQTLTFTAVDLKRGRLLRAEYLFKVDPPPS